MKKNILFILALAIVAGCSDPQPQKSDSKQPAKYVNVFVGTKGHGHTYPGATVPFGMVQVSPDNGKAGWDWSSGYNYSSHQIAGFSMTHLSGTGVGDGYDLSFMPFEGTKADTSHHGLYSKFSHKNENGAPGYYHVKLKNGIGVDLTAAKRVGFYRYHFPKKSKPAISLNLGFSINADSTTASKIHVVNDTLIVGYRMSTGWAHNQKVYFAAEFSRPINQFTGFGDGQRVKNDSTLKGRVAHGFFFFKPSGGSPLGQKVAISAVSIKNAKMNLQKGVPGWDFDKVKKSARDAWNKQLKKITVQSNDSSKLRTFYTALYHTMLGPTLYSDVNHQYRGADDQVHTANGFKAYSTWSLWDTFRAEHPLLIFIQPDRINGFVKFMLEFYDHHGLLPKWELYANETGTMIGYSAVPVIADAYFKGFRDYDVQKAYKAMKKSATEQSKSVKLFNKYGYVPADKAGESVSKTLLYSFDDWCIAQMAKALGKKDDYQTYSKRAEGYQNIFNKKNDFMQPKLANGKWKTPFDPYSESRHYTEANAWQDIWYVPQNVPKLIEMMGGKQAFIDRLDTLFTRPPKLHGNKVPDVSGLIGQYVQGNEPDMQVPFMYDYAGAPWQTQKVTRLIADSLYNDTAAGLPGNEDVGQMSAWYVFSALGFYPVNPDNGIFMIGSPIFPKATIHLKGDKTFTVIAHHVSKKNKYIQSAKLNGKSYNKPYVTYQDMMKGDTLEFKMGPKPNKEWGASPKDMPPLTTFGH
jgi:predicted alpha-1,2-mannosidase